MSDLQSKIKIIEEELSKENFEEAKIKIYQIDINHRKRFIGMTQVYKLHKFPIIFIKNFLGLIKLKLAN